MPNPRPHSFLVTKAVAGQRLDRALVQRITGVSRTRIQELIGDGGVRVDGVIAERSSLVLEQGWRVEILDVERTRVRRGGVHEGDLIVLFEDEHLAVIDKEAGCVVHPSSVVRGGTVSERAVQQWGDLPALQGEDRPGIVHRLDADTTGAMVIARTEAAAVELVRMFRDREVKKRYLALLFGVPRFDTDWIDTPIGRAKGRPDRMSVLEPGEGLEAITYYETLERFKRFGYVACSPKTGRTHQIRVHFSSIDHPLVGDRVYRGRRGLSRTVPRGAPPMTRHALHASELDFRHPVTGAALHVHAPLPADFEAWLLWLRTSRESAAT